MRTLAKLMPAVLFPALMWGVMLGSAQAQDAPADAIYRDAKAPLEARVEDLLARMTLEEKIAQLAGDPSGMATPDNERLGIPGFTMSDGPHGCRHGQATGFPTLLALGATWDEDLLLRVGEALGREFRGKGRYVALGPCINIIRDPRGGRSFETLSEDPYHMARLAVAYVKGMQSEKVIATAKHYACNNQEDGRGTNDVRVGERALRELYLPHFKACVQEGGVWAIMAAYNLVNGDYSAANRPLLRDILKDEWGFAGIVMSDWGACHETVGSINGGLDLEMPNAHFFGEPLLAAVDAGEVSEEVIDDAVRRVLRAKFWAGVFEEPVEPDESQVNTPEHQALALEAARKAIVLLKNDGGILPIDRTKVSSIAVIGPNADSARATGGGSSFVTPYYTVSPLAGIRSRAGEGIRVDFVQGCTLGRGTSLLPVRSSELRPAGDGPDEEGLLGEYFNNQNLEGEPALTRVDSAVKFRWGGDSPADEIGADDFSVRWRGKLVPRVTGTHFVGVTTDDGARLYVDGVLMIDNWRDHGVETRMVELELRAGREYDIRMEFYENGGEAVAELVWAEPNVEADPFVEAREAARGVDLAVVVVGTSAGIETEGRDRNDLGLPGLQRPLIQAVCEANPNTVVALVSGSAILMHRWIDQAPAVLQCWFGGQEAGNALADVLFGNADAGGKLPLTFPLNAYQLPSFDNNYETIGENRGYRYYDKVRMEPLFPFGYGLSYTRFAYSDLRVTPEEITADDSVRVSVDIQNIGERAGDEIAQLYVRDVQAYVQRPEKELKGFRRVHLAAGEKRTVEFELKTSDLAFYDLDTEAWVAEPGEFEVMIGASSRDIRATAGFVLR